MKKLLLPALILASLSTKAQVHSLHNKKTTTTLTSNIYNWRLNNDTLHVNPCTIHYIVIGDKTYRIAISLEEVKPITGLYLGSGTITTSTIDNKTLINNK